MTVAFREQIKNATETALDGSINNSVTSIDVDDGSVFPSTGNFRINVEGEIMKVTARSSDTLTVVRGQDGTSAASHGDDAPVMQVISPQGFDALQKDNIGHWGYSSLPPLNKLVADGGVTLLTASDFSWVNQGGASISDDNGTILLSMPTSTTTEAMRVLTRSAPSTPYTYITAFQPNIPVEGSPGRSQFFTGFRESSSGKMVTLILECSQNTNGRAYRFCILNWDNATTRNGTVPVAESFISLLHPVYWMKVEDDGTNLKFYLGMEGVEWIQILSVGRTAHMAGGPDQVIWGGNCPNNAGYGGYVRLLHWSKGGATPLLEQNKTLSDDTLDGSIDGSQTTLDVNDGSQFPSTGNFRLLIDDEILICTARSSDTLTVVRGQEGTSGASHANAAPVYHIVTAGALDRMGQDYVQYWNRAPAFKIANDAGTGLLTVSDFTWDNQGGATAVDENGTIGLVCPAASGTNYRVLYKTAPSTPYAYIGMLRGVLSSTQGGGSAMGFGIGVRKNSSGQIHTIETLVTDSAINNVAVLILTNSTTVFTSQKSGNHAWITQDVWFKVEDDGSNLKWYIGLDGSNWLKVADFGRTTYMSGGPDQVCFFIRNSGNNANDSVARLCHWSKE
jgi:hypothetical protein